MPAEFTLAEIKALQCSVDSGDMMDGDENEAIKAVFDFAKSIDKHFAS